MMVITQELRYISVEKYKGANIKAIPEHSIVSYLYLMSELIDNLFCI